jgi:hypothetical protein
MIKLFYGLESYNVDTFEYAYLVESEKYDADTFKLHIPKLMPNIASSTADYPIQVNKTNLFENAKSCTPTVDSVIYGQRYITVPRFPGDDFKVRADKTTGKLKVGTKFIVMVMNRNIKDLIIYKVL